MSAPVLELLPAVDISEGYAVRPVGGTCPVVSSASTLLRRL